MAGPAQSGRVPSSVTLAQMKSIISAQVRRTVPSTATAPSFPAAWASRRRPAGDLVHDDRVLVAVHREACGSSGLVCVGFGVLMLVGAG
jgi:hypothetical protein